MALNFHQLHIFYAVAVKGSFSAAASGLHMTQPAVTMQIRSLEQYFGTKLFHRSTKKVALSDAGEALLPYAMQAIEFMKQTEQAMAGYTQSLKAKLQLGTSLTFGEYIMPRILGPFAKEYPHISVSMKVMNTKQILDEILSHKLTFGLVEAKVDHPDVQIEPVLSDELKLIVWGDHPLANVTQPRIEDVLEYPFILREKGSGTRQVMEEELIRRQIDPARLQIVSELGSTGAVKSAVEAGLGISILSQSSVKHEITLGLLKAKTIEGFQFNRHFYSVHLNTLLLPISAVTFLSFLRERDLAQWI